MGLEMATTKVNQGRHVQGMLDETDLLMSDKSSYLVSQKWCPDLGCHISKSACYLIEICKRNLFYDAELRSQYLFYFCGPPFTLLRFCTKT